MRYPPVKQKVIIDNVDVVGGKIKTTFGIDDIILEILEELQIANVHNVQITDVEDYEARLDIESE